MEPIEILLAEDDTNLGTLLKSYLTAKSFNVHLTSDGESALRQFKKSKFSIGIFDIMMPELDGIALARQIRELNPSFPIIFLTAKNQHEDIIEGFNAGADDYITKPFSMEELLLRIEAILRRSSKKDLQANEHYSIGHYQFDTTKQLLTFDGNSQKLTTKEADLLKLLCMHSNQILERNWALTTVWQDDNYFNARSMDVYITKLRKYLKNDTAVQIINIHGKGYKLIC